MLDFRNWTGGERWLAGGLLLLAFVPSLAGTLRLFWLAGVDIPLSEGHRFLTMPVPVVVHILGALVFGVFGILQFIKSARQTNLNVHRMLGKFVLIAGLAVAASGLWMSVFYDLPAQDGRGLQIVRVMVGLWMLTSLLVAFKAILLRRVACHQNWMIRAYAVAMGAGTQVFTHLPYQLLVGEVDALSKFWLMSLGWAINVVVAEWIIVRKSSAHVRLRRAD